MRVFKFGGASVKDAASVRNVAEIIRRYQQEPLLVVISAMGKTTNALEELTTLYYKGNKKKALEILYQVKDFHDKIISELADEKSNFLFVEVDNLFVELESMLDKQAEGNFDYVYDQLVCFGEIISTRIVSAYLLQAGINNRWVDARNFIFTDTSYRQGRINWALTEDMIGRRMRTLAEKQLVITQGFIGKNQQHATVTLGREGSDYTAAIMAYCLNAKEVVIWKDVAGVMNADPKRIPDAVKIDELTYNVAIELAYYGATVIHPKTIQPLKSKGIPLYVKSFVQPDQPGTIVHEGEEKHTSLPYFIFKQKQALVKIASRDFSFIVEDNLKHIFSVIADCGITVNVMQNSAISFVLCVNDDEDKLNTLKESLQKDFQLEITPGVELITIRNYNDEAIKRMLTGRQLLLEQKSSKVIQFVVL